MTTTHDLIVQAGRLVAHLEDAGGELSEESAAELERVLLASEDKAAALISVDRAMSAEVDRLNAERKRIDARARAIERGKERVRGLLLELVRGQEALSGERKIRTDVGTAYILETTRVEGPEDVDQWPALLQRHVTTTTPNKSLAKDLLTNGETFEGVRLVTDVRVGVR